MSGLIGATQRRDHDHATHSPATLPAQTKRQSQPRCSCGGTIGPTGECDACRTRPMSPSPAHAPPATHSALAGSSGRPLDSQTLSFMQLGFGHDFGQVRIHTDKRAETSAAAIDALAFTVGREIFFGPQSYQPGTNSGRRLIAHELAHVVQQHGGAGGFASEAELEEDAERASRNVLESRSVSVAARAPAGSVQRAAPAVGAAVLKAYALRCFVGAVVGAVLDLVIQYGLHSWRRWRPPWERESIESFRADWCSTILSAGLGCLGGMASLRWLEPFLKRAFPSLSGAGATIIGRLLLWSAEKAGIGVPRAIVKWLLKWGCVSPHEAEALAPGVAGETVAEAPAEAPAEDGRTEARA